MLITVIVPIYNMEAYLCTSLDRLLQQSFQDYEILLIDDGSKDSSGEICDRYAREHSRIRVVHKPNGGLSTARNAGIEHARGEYLTFCDPDDWVDADYLQQFVEAGMDEHTLPVTGILQHREGKSDRRLTAPAMDVQGQACTEAIVVLRRHDMLGFTVNKLLVKRIIDENGLRFIEGLSHREDEIFLLQYIPHVSRIVINEKTPYHYRALGSSLSKKRKPTELILRVSRQLHDLFPTGRTFPGRALCRSPHPVATMLRGGRGVENERGAAYCRESGPQCPQRVSFDLRPRVSHRSPGSESRSPQPVGLRPRNSLRQAASTPYPIDSHINPLHHVEIRLPDRRSRTFSAQSQLTGPHGPVRKRWSSTDGPTRAETLTARSAKASASTNTAPTSSTPPTAKCGSS